MMTRKTISLSLGLLLAAAGSTLLKGEMPYYTPGCTECTNLACNACDGKKETDNCAFRLGFSNINGKCRNNGRCFNKDGKLKGSLICRGEDPFLKKNISLQN